MMRFWIFLLTFLSMDLMAAAAEPWKDLFDGRSLYGWVQRNGKASTRSRTARSSVPPFSIHPIAFSAPRPITAILSWNWSL